MITGQITLQNFTAQALETKGKILFLITGTLYLLIAFSGASDLAAIRSLLSGILVAVCLLGMDSSGGKL